MKTNKRDYYFTIKSDIRAEEIKILGSRFIAELCSVSTKEAVDQKLQQVRKHFYDATHHCYAYRLGKNAELVRAADDGEPAGTAGRPILTALEAVELTNVLCIVTRFFGGTKLGTGPLARAYSESAHLAIKRSNIKRVFEKKTLRLISSYNELPMLERFLIAEELKPSSMIYDQEIITLQVEIRESKVTVFTQQILERFWGKVIVA